VSVAAVQQQLLAAARALSKAQRALKDSSNSSSSSSGGGSSNGGVEAAAEAVADAVEQLRELGLQLTAVPIPYACNNPNCGNVQGPSEQQLVGGRSCLCGGCCAARYCSRECQRQHWKQHKPVCKALKATASSRQLPPSTA
jgi:hypothetical protein